MSYSASKTRMACWCSGSESASTPSMSKMTASIASPGRLRRASSASLMGQRVLEQGHLGNRFGDLPIERHADRLRHRHHGALEEFVVVGGQRIGREAMRHVAPRHLVEVGGGRPEAREKHEALGAVTALLAQLPLRGGLGRLAGQRAAARQLPRRRADTGIFFAGAKSRGFSSELTAQDKEFLRAVSIKPER